MADEADTEGVRPGLPGWLWPTVGGGAVLLVLAAWFAGWLADRHVALLLALVCALALAGLALRGAFASPSGLVRTLSVPYVALFLVCSLFPVKVALLPGAPTAEAVLQPGESLPLSKGGDYRIVVRTQLRSESQSEVAYTLRAGTTAISGRLEGVFVRGRAGKQAVRSLELHDVAAHEETLPADTTELRVESAQGLLPGRGLTVQAFREPPRSLWYALAALVLLGGVVLEGRAAARGALAMTSSIALFFGLFIDKANPNPASSVGAVIGSALLAGAAGALLGSLQGALGRKLFPAPEPAKGRTPRPSTDE